MSLKRDAFDDQIWYPYWKKQHPTVEAPRAELVATPTVNATPVRPSVSATPERPYVRYAPATPSASVENTPKETTTHSSGSLGGNLVVLIAIGAVLYWLIRKLSGSGGSPTPPPVNDADTERQLKTLKVLLLANQPGGEKAIECLRNPRVDNLKISDDTGEVADLKGENGEPWLIPYRCPQYMPRKGEILLWGFDNVKYYHQGTHSEWQGGHAGVSVRVAKGLWVRTGTSRGHSVSHQSMDFKGTGTLLITNQGFAFLGAETIRVLFTHIVSMDYYKDGVGFDTDRARNNRYVFANMQTVSAMFVKDAIEVLNGGESSLLKG